MHLIMGEAEHGTGREMIAQSRRGRRAEPSGEFFTTDFTDGHGWGRSSENQSGKREIRRG